MADDAIGYGRPPKRTRYVKGQSGNPSGRPKGSQNLAAVVHTAIRQRIKVTENGRVRYTTKFEAIIAQLVNKALRGDVNATHELRYWIQFLEDSLQTNSQPMVSRENDEAVMARALERLRQTESSPAPDPANTDSSEEPK
jgi:hypothetical protein